MGTTACDTAPDAIGERPSLRGFEHLRAAFRTSGGIANGEDVARLLEEHHVGDLVSLARLIANHQLLGFEWNHSFWIPMFQLTLSGLSLQLRVASVVAELHGVLDGWNLAAWFVHPHPHLGGCRPVDVLATAVAEVTAAASIDREQALRRAGLRDGS